MPFTANQLLTAEQQVAPQAKSDTEAGSGSEDTSRIFFDVDTGSGAEDTSRATFDTDTGSGADPETATVLPTSADTGAGADASALVTAAADTDTGAGADPQTLAVTWSTDFDSGTLASIFPGGTVNASLDTTLSKSGPRSLLVNGDPAYGNLSWPGSATTVFRFYIRLASIPSQGVELLTLFGGPRFGIDNATQKFGWVNGTSQTMDHLSGVTPNAGQWYLVDVRLNQTANPWVLDYQIDTVAQTQITYATAASTVSGVYVGHSTGFSVPIQVNFDDVALSQTSGDYPLGPSSVPKSDTDTGAGVDSATTGLSYAYQWQRDTTYNGVYVDIPGATSSTHVVVSADTGCNVRCNVTATNLNGSTTAASNAVAIPFVDTDSGSGLDLESDIGGINYTYQWQRDVNRNGVYSNIGSATGRTYVVVTADTGCNVRSVVTATNANGPASAFSNAVAIPGIPVSSSDTGSGADAELGSKGEAGVGVDVEKIGIVSVDTATSVEVGSSPASQSFTSTDPGTGTDGQLLSNSTPTSIDAGVGAESFVLGTGTSGHGVDTEILTVGSLSGGSWGDAWGSTPWGGGGAASGLDTGVGVDAQTLTQASLTSQTSTDTAAGTDAFNFAQPAADVGASVDDEVLDTPTDVFWVVSDSGGSISRQLSDLSDTDNGTGSEGSPGLIGPLGIFWGASDWGAELIVGPGQANEQAVGVDLDPDLHAAAISLETGVGVDVAAVQAGSNQLINDADVGAGADPEAIINNTGVADDTDAGAGVDTLDRVIASEDANSATGENTNIGIPDPDYGASTEVENVLLADLDTGFGSEVEFFQIASADTGSGADANLAVTYKDGDTATSLEIEGKKQPDLDSGHGFEEDILRQITNQITVIDVVQEGAGAETTRIGIVSADTGSGAESIGSSNDQGFGVETATIRVVGLVFSDSGVGHSFAFVSLPFLPDPTGILTLVGDPPGALTIARDTPGVLVLSGATSGALTLAPDAPGSLVLVADGDTQE